MIVKNIRAFMLIEVLIALTLFALSAGYLVEGAFVATRTMRLMKNPRESEQLFLWARSEIFRIDDFEELKDGGDLPTHRNIEIQWEVTSVEMTQIVDLYRVSLLLSHNGSDELRMDPETRNYVMLLLRPNWGRQRDFISDRQRLVVDKKELIRELDEDRPFLLGDQSNLDLSDFQ